MQILSFSEFFDQHYKYVHFIISHLKILDNKCVNLII